MDAEEKRLLVGIIEVSVPAVGIVASLAAYKAYDYTTLPVFASFAGLIYSIADILIREENSSGRGVSEWLFSPVGKLCGGVKDKYGWFKTWYACRGLGRGDEFV